MAVAVVVVEGSRFAFLVLRCGNPAGKVCPPISFEALHLIFWLRHHTMILLRPSASLLFQRFVW